MITEGVFMSAWRTLQVRQKLERQALLREALERNDWGLTATSRMLGLSRSSLRGAITAHDLDPEFQTKKKPRGRPRKIDPEIVAAVERIGA